MPDVPSLIFDDGFVYLGGDLLPGILRNLSIRGSVRYDQSHHDNMSGKSKTALGWEDAGITLTLDLLCDKDGDCYAKLLSINKIFKGATRKNTTPKIYTVSGRHLNSRGIARVVFDGLDSTETDDDDVIQAQLTFTEHLPAVIKHEQRSAGTKAGAAPAVTAKQPTASPTITSDSTNPFVAGYRSGRS